MSVRDYCWGNSTRTVPSGVIPTTKGGRTMPSPEVRFRRINFIPGGLVPCVIFSNELIFNTDEGEWDFCGQVS